MTESSLTIVYRPLGELIPYARNSRTHSEAQVAQIAASIREFGFTNPVLVDPDGGIIAGHGRVMAARKLALDAVPTITLHGLSEAQKRAYVIADNKLALNAGWDTDLLKIELDDLKLEGFDLELTGFTPAEINFTLNGWTADAGALADADGEHTDGIDKRLMVQLAASDAPQARELIENALTRAGIEFEIK